MMRVDDTDIKRVLDDGKKLHKNPSKFLEMIGRAEVNMARDRVRTGKKDPDGRPWAPWEPATREQRRKKGTASRGLLFDSGFLYNSFTSRVSGKRVTISNTSPYASYLNNGVPGRMPPRVFLGWGSDTQESIENIYRKHLKRWK